jgi:hypothetical protein
MKNLVIGWLAQRGKAAKEKQKAKRQSQKHGWRIHCLLCMRSTQSASGGWLRCCEVAWKGTYMKGNVCATHELLAKKTRIYEIATQNAVLRFTSLTMPADIRLAPFAAGSSNLAGYNHHFPCLSLQPRQSQSFAQRQPVVTFRRDFFRP